jgi:hypothetical protein
MAITRARTSSVAQGPSTRKTVLGGNDVILGGSFDAIGTTAPSGVATVTFSSIPSTYKHLQIRINAILASAGQSVYLRFNGVSTAGAYKNHGLYGNGASAGASGGGPTSALYAVTGWISGSVTTHPNVGIIDILDYANTNKNKTIRSLNGADNNSTGGSIELSSGMWINTNAITSIEVYAGANYNSGTTIDLYGIK